MRDGAFRFPRQAALSISVTRAAVHFAVNAVMYEVITFRGDEAWLADILKTLQFE